MELRLKGGKRVLVVVCVLLLCLFIRSGSAESFPFRTVKIGDRIADLAFTPMDETGPAVTTAHLSGQNIALVFIGGDLAAKKKRSVKVLKVLAQMQDDLKKDGVDLLIVDVQDDSESIVQEMIDQAGLTNPVYRDQGRRAYAALGLYVLPSVLLVDQTGTITGGLGYSKDFAQRFSGEVDILKKRKTRDEVEADLNREMKSVPKEKKMASRHLRMGLTMRSKGMLEAALREMDKALELDNTLAEAYIEKGCLLVELGKIEEAVQALDTGMEKEPQSVRAEICLARADAKEGHLDDALADLQELLFRHSRDAQLHYTIGTMQESKGDMQGAAQSYRKAFELLHERQMLGEE